jgi:uncharacterized protein (TIGR02118 family)
MKRVIVNYGKPEDDAQFDAHYRDVHIPLVLKLPHLSSFEISVGDVASSDEANPIHLVAVLTYADQEALDASLSSPEGEAAVADLENFATGGVTILTIEAQKLA